MSTAKHNLSFYPCLEYRTLPGGGINPGCGNVFTTSTSRTLLERWGHILSTQASGTALPCSSADSTLQPCIQFKIMAALTNFGGNMLAPSTTSWRSCVPSLPKKTVSITKQTCLELLFCF